MAEEQGGQPAKNGDENPQLRSFIERIERLQEEKQALQEDIKEVIAEAKAMGYDVKAVREVVRLRARDRDQLKEHSATVRLYLRAVDPQLNLDLD